MPKLREKKVNLQRRVLNQVILILSVQANPITENLHRAMVTSGATPEHPVWGRERLRQPSNPQFQRRKIDLCG